MLYPKRSRASLTVAFSVISAKLRKKSLGIRDYFEFMGPVQAERTLSMYLAVMLSRTTLLLSCSLP